MIVYDGCKTDFMNSVENDTIANEISDCILKKIGRHTPNSEFRAWMNSLKNMYIAINDNGIPDNSGIAIEYNIPQTAKRVDFMISGYNNSGKPGMVIIELKQWKKLNKVPNTETLVETYVGGAMRKVVHPSYQAWSYAKLIEDYNSSVQKENIILSPCSYLHNYVRDENDPIDDRQYSEYINEVPAFSSGQLRDLREFIKKNISKGDNKNVLYLLEQGKIKPSKSLQDSIGSMIDGNKEFVMIDEQQVIYEEVIRLSELCQKDGKKRTIICKGGPGTGKSVIAVNLLAELTKRNQFVQYVSKNSAPRQVYIKKLKGNRSKASIDNMFKGSGNYVDTHSNFIDTLVVDEAHRLNDKSGMFHNKGENQIKEIIHASKCSVFFIDENQRVTTYDIGSIDEIKKYAMAGNSEIFEMELASQFRCNGSNGYLAWIDNAIEIKENANFSFDGLDYEFEICDTPKDLLNKIKEKNSINNKSRVLAGYCWDWPKTQRRNKDYHDIKIGDFSMSWNLDDGESFAIASDSVNEAGCIHTTQGLEFDYVGVIIGNDIRYENEKVITDFTKRAQTDQSLKGIKELYKKEPDRAIAIADSIIKNTYRTLMTRGMKGCYIYCLDKPLQEHFKRLLEIHYN